MNKLLKSQDYHAISGIVQHGKKEARKMGFPTANIVCSEEFQSQLKEGIYGAMTQIPSLGPSTLASIAYVKDSLLEVHLLDSHLDLYDQHIMVNLTQFIRPPVSFTTLDAMRSQIERDIKEVRSFGA